MAAGDLSANPATLSALDDLIKVVYGESIPHLINQMSPFLAKLKKKSGFQITDKGFGRQIEWPYKIARGENVGVRGQGQYQPGYSGDTLDTLDVMEAVTATLNRAKIYSGFVVDGEWLSPKVNKKHMFNAGDQFAQHVTDTLEDIARQLLFWLFGDQTGYLGRVNGAVSSSTTITLHPYGTIDARGRLSNILLRKNMLIDVIPVAHWASSPTVSQADADEEFKVSSASDIGDRSAAPTITSTAAVTLSDGDVLIPYRSRTRTATGSATGATLYGMIGLFQLIDDGTIATNLYGNSRTTYPILKSPVNLSTSERTLTHTMLQALRSRLEDRCDQKELANHVIVSHSGVRNKYAADDATTNKRYIQEGKAIGVVSGFNDISMAFMGGDRLVPWVCDRDFPPGHLMYLNLEDLHVMWDKEPGVMNEDGQTLRKVPGLDQYEMDFAGYGNFMMERPMHSARMSGLAGSYS